MLIAFDYPNGQRATQWQKHILAGSEALEIIPSTRRIASAVAAHYFNTKTIAPQIWGVESITPKDLASLQTFFTLLAEAKKSWYIPEYTLSTVTFFSDTNTERTKKEPTLKQRADRIIRYTAPLYLQIEDNLTAQTIYQELKNLDYLGRSESIIEVSLHNEKDVNLEGHIKYEPRPHIVAGSQQNIELKPNCKVQEVIDTAPLAVDKIKFSSKLALPKDCEYIWWEATSKAKTTYKAKETDKKWAKNRLMLKCLAPAFLTDELTMKLLTRLSNLKIDLESINITPQLDLTGINLLGWVIEIQKPIDLISIAEIAKLRLMYEDSFIDYECKIDLNSKIYGQRRSKHLFAVTPVFIANVESIDEAVKHIETLENIESCVVDTVCETTLGTGLKIRVTTKNPVEKIQIGEAQNLGFGTLFPLNNGVLA